MAAININFRDLTLDNIYLWPLLIKKIVTAILCVFILILGWLFDTRHLFNQLGLEKNNGLALQKELLIKQKKLIEINVHPEQLQILQEKIKIMAISKQRRKEPLEFFPIESLKMVGILKKSNTRWALITTSSNVVYQIKEGSYIGQNNGRVITITDNSIEILELVPEPGGLEKQRVLLKIPNIL